MTKDIVNIIGYDSSIYQVDISKKSHIQMCRGDADSQNEITEQRSTSDL
jgi:hypothetical protein